MMSLIEAPGGEKRMPRDHSDRLGDLVKRWLGYALISVGGFFLLAFVLLAFDWDSSEPKRSAALGMVLLGVPPLTAGGLMVSSSHRMNRLHRNRAFAAYEHELRRTLYLLIAEKQGRFTPLQYAIAADISLDEAEIFLNNQSKLLNADFDVTTEGTLVYLFPGS